MRTPILPAVAALVTACSSPASTVYVAPTPQNIIGSMEEGSGSISQVFYLTNSSSVPIVVYSVTLRSCENIRESCEPMKVNIRIAPGMRVPIKRIEPRNPSQPFRFHTTYAWRAEAGKAAVAVLAQGGPEIANVRPDASPSAIAQAVPGEIRLYHPQFGYFDINAVGARAVAMRSLTDSIVIPTGVRMQMRMPVFLLDAQGQRIGQIMGVLWQVTPAPSVRVVSPDTLMMLEPGRTTAEFRLPDGVPKGRETPFPPVRVTIVVRERPGY